MVHAIASITDTQINFATYNHLSNQRVLATLVMVLHSVKTLKIPQAQSLTTNEIPRH